MWRTLLIGTDDGEVDVTMESGLREGLFDVVGIGVVVNLLRYRHAPGEGRSVGEYTLKIHW